MDICEIQQLTPPEELGGEKTSLNKTYQARSIFSLAMICLSSSIISLWTLRIYVYGLENDISILKKYNKN